MTAFGPRQRAPTIASAPRVAPLVAALLAIAATSAAVPSAAATIFSLPDSLETGRQLIQASRFDDAEALARRCLSRIDAGPARDSLPAADVLDLLAETMRRSGKGRDPDARSSCDRALRIRERIQGDDHVATAATLHNLGSLLYVTGDYPAARPVLERSLAIRTRLLGVDHPDVAMSLLYLGSLLSDMGDAAGARPMLERAVSIQERSLAEDNLDRAFGLERLANLLYMIRDYEGARPLYERSLAIREAALGPDDTQVGISLHNLATLLVQMGDLDAARAAYGRALVIREKHEKTAPLLLASTLANLGDLMLSMGETATASRLLDRALRIRVERLGPEHPDVAWVLLSSAACREAEGDARAADSLIAHAIAIQETALGPDHPAVAMALAQRARLRAADDPDWALDAALRAEEIESGHLRATARALAERQALGYAEGTASGLEIAISILVQQEKAGSERNARSAGSVSRVWDALIRSRALVLDEIARRAASAHLGDRRLLALADSLAEARERLANAWVRGTGADNPAEDSRRLELLQVDVERAERALADGSAGSGEERERDQIGYDAVSSALPEDAALVAYAFAPRIDGPERQRSTRDDARVAFVLRAGGGTPAFVSLGPAARIDTLIARWSYEATRGALDPTRSPGSAEAAYRAAGESLRAVLWDPVVSLVAGARRLFIVPDGPVHLVSFGALPAAAGRYLVEEGPLLHYLTTERDVVPPHDARAVGEGLLCVGGPDFDGGDSAAWLAAVTLRPRGGDAHAARGNLASIRFGPLPSAAVEAQEVAQEWLGAAKGRRPGERAGANALCLTGEDAVESAFKRMAPGRRVLHLATHAFFLADSLEPSGAPAGTRGVGGLSIGSTGPSAGGPAPILSSRRDVPRRDPLLLAGLALAGANRRQSASLGDEDGILLAEEIAALDLRGVEWAVLSACDTGVGEIRASEGVLGLRRAFQVAGVRTLVMSLWGVDDEATRSWMRSLYDARFGRGLETAVAVRDASLAAISSLRSEGRPAHPFYWGGFVAVGDWK